MARRTCSHLMEVRAFPSPAMECAECVAMGDRWVHLRQCTSCGHVACCDDSKNRHATAHYRASLHPVIRSIEPSEAWGWCYAEEMFINPLPMPRRTRASIRPAHKKPKPRPLLRAWLVR